MPDPDPHSSDDQDDPTIRKITVVCTGNICRSPMGGVILADELASSHPEITVNSCGLGGWHVGEGADPRAIAELQTLGYDGSDHRAAQFGPKHADADIFLAMDKGHERGLEDMGVDPEKIHLFRGFDPASVTVKHPQPEVADPYYGTEQDFHQVGQQIMAALPGILEYVDSVNGS